METSNIQNISYLSQRLLTQLETILFEGFSFLHNVNLIASATAKCSVKNLLGTKHFHFL